MYTTLHWVSRYKAVIQYKSVIAAQPVETNVQHKCTQLYTGYPNIRLSLGHNLWKQMSNRNVHNFTPAILA